MLEIIGVYVLQEYVISDLLIALYVMLSVSLSQPHCEPERALRMLLRCLTFVVMLLMCCLNVSVGSSVMPRIFGCLLRGRTLLSIVICGCMFVCDVCGVKSVTVDLLVDKMRLRDLRKVLRLSR